MGDAESVTISLLPVSLSLVHLPRSRLEDFTQHILRQILQPNPVFLNVTCNEIEVSLFAEHDSLQHFHKAARKDVRKLRRLERERDAHQDSRCSPRRSRHVKPDWEPVEVTYERWKVLQIDSHSDSINNSGARVHELSAPLAAAGISILYQSSYMSDFIFAIVAYAFISSPSVKEGRLAEVMSLLGSAGFDLYLSDPTNLTAQISTFASPMVSPTSEDEQSISLIELNSFHAAGRNSIDTTSGVVFTRSRSNTSGTTSSSGSRSREFLLGSGAPVPTSEEMPSDTPPVPDRRPPLNRVPSRSPSACDVRVLSPDMTCVGLSDDSADTWGLKIVKLVAFPELILGHSGTHVNARASENLTRPPRASSPSLLSALPEEHIHLLSFNEGDIGSGSDTTTRVAPESPKKDPTGADDADPAVFEFDDTATDHSSDEEDAHRVDENLRSRRPGLGHLDTLQTITPDKRNSPPSSRSRSTSSSSSDFAPPPLVPFFSFTQKHGLVNRFSRTLEENGINHMYSSTYKTANLLIDKAHASRAQALLRSC
ncbi:hypothetical protein BN946_scf185015.g64 [Trametes cinnabarina]|uniref:CASTOR ACT domain-containing protein n=1 Tax=Pycnoporus cinnabarinus TaxID=5643 RepID=A0A060SHS8_PYCCI|nr:hypothetical protein BN946_scf185015.g64 [Trametes cinnabarina]